MKINYHQLSIAALHDLLVKKVITIEQLINLVLARLKKFEYLNATVTSLETEARKMAKQLTLTTVDPNNFLFGIPYATKDNIATINIKTTASSKILANYIPSYNSTVNTLLDNKKAINIAKTALDELGMGGDGLYAATGYVYNPWNTKLITGGSSSGSAALVAAGVVPFALGTDTGDSVRKPAALCGVVGYKPTYGLISRYGVIPYAPSLDTVGILANHVSDVAIVLDTLAQQDQKDFTSCKSKESNYYQNLQANVAKLKIAVLNYDYYLWTKPVKAAFDEALTHLKNGNAIIDYVDIDGELLQAVLPVYMMTSFSEATSCHAGLDGVNFGSRIMGKNYRETMIKTRTAGFGTVVKRRQIIGAYVLSEKYEKQLLLKAQKVRRVIANTINKLLETYDAFIIMANVEPAPKISDILEKKKVIHSYHQYMDDLLVLANLNGSPSITIPLTTVANLPIGISINGIVFGDQTVLNIAHYLQKQLNFRNPLLGVDDE